MVAPLVGFAVELARFLAIAFRRDHGLDVQRLDRGDDVVAVIALVAEQRVDLVADHPQECHEAFGVVGLTRREREAERAALAVAARVDFGREAAARAAERFLILSSLFMPTAQ